MSTKYYVQDKYFSDWVNNWLYNSNYNAETGIFDEVRTQIPVGEILAITVIWEQDGQEKGTQVLPAERRYYTITGLTAYSTYDVTVTYKFMSNVDENDRDYGKNHVSSLGSTIASTDTPNGTPASYQLVAGESYKASDFGYGSLGLSTGIEGKNTCTLYMDRNLTVSSIAIENGYTLILTGSGTLTVKQRIYSNRQIDAGGHVIKGIRGYLKIKDHVSVNVAEIDIIGVDIDTAGEVIIKPTKVYSRWYNRYNTIFGIDLQGALRVYNGTVIVDGGGYDIGIAVRCYSFSQTGGSLTIRNVDRGMIIIGGNFSVLPGSEGKGVDVSITAKDSAVAFDADISNEYRDEDGNWHSRSGDLILEDPDHLIVPAGGFSKIVEDRGAGFIVDAAGNIATKVVVSIDPGEAGPVKDFVRRCYRLILNRKSDKEGLKGWSEALENNTTTAAQTINGFLTSEEFTNRMLDNYVVIEILYQTMLNRTAELDGKNAWAEALEQGYTLQNIIDGFCASPEFISLCEEYGIEPGSTGAFMPAPADSPRGKIEAFVKRCYELILGRKADREGLQAWGDALESRQATAAQIIDGFVRSEEYLNRNLDKARQVDILYNTMLDREADFEGLYAWIDALEQGYTLQHIINGFCGSPEFTALCENYGIVAGSVAVGGTMIRREGITPESDETEAPIIFQGYASEFINEEKVRAFVEHCYAAVFGREGDAEGIENYTQAILNGKKSPKKVAYEFIFSAEFQNNLPGNEDFIRILYRLYFDREPGADELGGWVQMLEDGASLEEIVNGFAGSDEFKAILNSMK